MTDARRPEMGRDPSFSAEQPVTIRPPTAPASPGELLSTLTVPGSSAIPPANQAVAAEVLPPRLGRYRLEEEIGRGGMGVIYRCHDEELNRSLALKVLLEKHKDNAELKSRFLDEARIMAQMQHPGIAPVHDIGSLPDGRPF